MDRGLVVTAEERFFAKVRQEGDCWIWTAAKYRNGYGQFSVGRSKSVRAHRWAYTFLVGPIPDGLYLDHVWERGCRSTLCVNPYHLEPVTHQVNVQRGHATRSQCPSGHERAVGSRCPICTKNTQRRADVKRGKSGKRGAK